MCSYILQVMCHFIRFASLRWLSDEKHVAILDVELFRLTHDSASTHALHEVERESQFFHAGTRRNSHVLSATGRIVKETTSANSLFGLSALVLTSPIMQQTCLMKQEACSLPRGLVMAIPDIVWTRVY
jgi:hypothetical protein